MEAAHNNSSWPLNNVIRDMICVHNVDMTSHWTHFFVYICDFIQDGRQRQQRSLQIRRLVRKYSDLTSFIGRKYLD